MLSTKQKEYLTFCSHRWNLKVGATVSALVNWWFNNSFTKEAIQADAEFERLKKSVH